MSSGAAADFSSLRIGTIVTCFNYDAFVADAIRSVLGQALRPQKLAIVNDGSTDGSAAAIQSALDHAEGVATEIVLIAQPNRGQLAALRRGLSEMSDIDIVTFLDADDTWSSDHLAAVHQAFAADPLLDVSYSSHWEAYHDGKRRQETEIQPGLMSGDWLRTIFSYAWRGAPTSAIAVRLDVAVLLFGGAEESGWRICADDLVVLGAAARQMRRRMLATTSVAYRMHGRNLYAAPSARLSRSRLNRTLRTVTLTGEARDRWRSMTRAERRLALRVEVQEIVATHSPVEARRWIWTLIRSVPMSILERGTLLADLRRTAPICPLTRITAR